MYRIYSKWGQDQILRGASFQKITKGLYIISATHEYKIDYEPMSPGH